MIAETNSYAETEELGIKLGKSAKPGMIICLSGDLGVGKTVFTQGFAKGLEITEPVCSPTFTIVQVYDSGRLMLYHFDLYRLGSEEELEEIGYEEYFYSDGVCLVEWGDMFPDVFPDRTIKINISKNLEKGFDYRKITIDGLEEMELGDIV